MRRQAVHPWDAHYGAPSAQLLATYSDRTALLADYPLLEPEDLQQALHYAAATVDDEVIIIPAQLAPGAAAILRHEGWDAIHASEINMQEADDAGILNAARSSARTCITLDHDFHAHLALTGLAFRRLCCCVCKAWTQAGQAALTALSVRNVRTGYWQVLRFQLTEPRFGSDACR